MTITIKSFFNALSHSFNPNGYFHIVDVKGLGESSLRIAKKRNAYYKEANKVLNEEIKHARENFTER